MLEEILIPMIEQKKEELFLNLIMVIKVVAELGVLVLLKEAMVEHLHIHLNG
jgi:hypothetical protein